MVGVRVSVNERKTSIIGAVSIEVKGFFFSTAKGVDLAMNIIGSRVKSVFGSIRYRLHCKYESLNSMATLT